MTRAELKEKDVVVLGLGRSGAAAASLLMQDGARVVVRDDGEDSILQERAKKLREIGVRVELGGRFDRSSRFDLAVLSPGIAPQQPIVSDLVASRIPLVGEIELAARYCHCPIIAITGTNGKTTTTELITAMLNGNNRHALAAGNIGFALSCVAEQSYDLDALVLEVSSFQLEQTDKFHPQVTVLLNITPDHLDRYSSMKDYAKAKAQIFENQTENDIAIVGLKSLQILKDLGISVPARTITFSTEDSSADCWLDPCDKSSIRTRLLDRDDVVVHMNDTHLKGIHNAENVLATVAVGISMGLSAKQIQSTIRTFEARAHRFEHVACIRGVTYINDSKATNIDAVEKAIHAAAGPVLLIAGGRNKGLDFSKLEDVVGEKVKMAFVIGESQSEICRVWSEKTNCICAASLHEAVHEAGRCAVNGDTVLLSPVCASFDMFRNYEERGNEFKRQVWELEEAFA